MPHDVVVVIPAYEPSTTLADIVLSLLAAGAGAVVLVDDGSGPDHAAAFDDLEGRPGVHLLRHEVNRGKGAALRTAFRHVMSVWPGTGGVVTADADGQHTVADIARVAAELSARSGQEDRVMVLGERDFDLPDIPLRSRAGNKITTALVQALYGRRVPDTQTGLRGLATDLLPELLEVPGDRFDYEMRALIHALSSRATVVPVPIETVYEGGENATSHFRPIRDSAIIYAALLRQLAVFGLTSGLGFVVDILVFVAVMDLVYDGHPTIRAVGVATVTARVVSALANYAANHLVVFRSSVRVHRSLGRYAVLAVGVLLASWLLTSGLSHLLGHHVVWAKLIVDTSLFVVSYLLQRGWVFRSR